MNQPQKSDINTTPNMTLANWRVFSVMSAVERIENICGGGERTQCKKRRGTKKGDSDVRKLLNRERERKKEAPVTVQRKMRVSLIL